MKIAPSIIIMLNDNTPIMRPQIEGHAIAAAYKNATFHTKIYDTDYYIAFTENTKQLFYEEEFLGGIIVVRHKGERINSNLECHPFSLIGDAVVINAKPGNILLSPAGDRNPTIIWEKEDINDVKNQFKSVYHSRLTKDPVEFEANWGKYVTIKPDFRYFAGRLTF